MTQHAWPTQPTRRTLQGRLGCFMLVGLLTLGASSVVSAQTLGGPPAPGEENPKPLPVQEDLRPKVPEQFDRPRPNYHVVQSGDTLFGISRTYFGSPYVWPIVWSFNDHITNPHWIYPGDIVYLRAPLPGDAPFDENGLDPFANSSRGLSVALAGFYMDASKSSDGDRDRDVEDIDGAVGKIRYSPETKKMLAFPDRVYIDLSDEQKKNVKKGDVFAVLRYDSKRDVVDPETDDTIARKYRVVGAIRIVETNKKSMDTAVVVQAWEEIYRGDVLFPYERQLLRVAPAVATKTVIGNVVDTLHSETLFGQHSYVFLNRGKKDGVRVGNRFFAYDREDGLSGLDTDEEIQIPYERVAQMLVIRADENYSTALITESRREIDPNTRVEMYEGY